MKIPKEIVDKVELAGRLIKEINEWCEDNLDIEGTNPRYANITDYHTGNEQGTDEGREWYDQEVLGEDWFRSEHYWETEYEGKYLHIIRRSRNANR